MSGRGGDHKARPRLELETLEERIAPAGNVIVTASGGTLTLTGDSDSNAFVIDDAGLPASQLRITPGAGTTINGGAPAMIFSGVNAIKMDLGEGDDSAVLNGIAVAKDVKVSAGGGDDTVVVNLSSAIGGSLVLTDVDTAVLAGASVARDVKVAYAADGQYAVVVDQTQVGGNFSIANRGQDQFSNYIFSDSTIDGKLTVSNKSGAHGPGNSTTLSISGSLVGGVSLKAGTGDYSFLFVDSETFGPKGSISLSYGVGQVTTVFDNSTVNGAVSMKVAGGLTAIPYTTSFALQNDSHINDKLAIKTGDSDDFVIFDKAVVVRGMNIDTGTGTTVVSMHDAGIGGERVGSKMKVYPSTIAQSTSGWSFDGDTTVVSIDTAEIGALAIRLRPQDSVVTFNRVYVATSLSIAGQGGDDLVTLRDVRLDGSTSIKTGGGNDIVCFDESDVRGPLSIDAGAGVDNVRMDTDVDNVVGEYLGPVKIALGAGDDYLQMGEPAVNGNRGHYMMAVTLDGGSGGDEIYYLNNGNVFDFSPKTPSFENTH